MHCALYCHATKPYHQGMDCCSWSVRVYSCCSAILLPHTPLPLLPAAPALPRFPSGSGACVMARLHTLLLVLHHLPVMHPSLPPCVPPQRDTPVQSSPALTCLLQQAPMLRGCCRRCSSAAAACVGCNCTHTRALTHSSEYALGGCCGDTGPPQMPPFPELRPAQRTQRPTAASVAR